MISTIENITFKNKKNMAVTNVDELIQQIQNVIKTNNNNEITGQILQDVLVLQSNYFWDLRKYSAYTDQLYFANQAAMDAHLTQGIYGVRLGYNPAFITNTNATHRYGSLIVRYGTQIANEDFNENLTDNLQQEFITVTLERFFRVYVSGVWGDWQKIPYESEVVSAFNNGRYIAKTNANQTAINTLFKSGCYGTYFSNAKNSPTKVIEGATLIVSNLDNEDFAGTSQICIGGKSLKVMYRTYYVRDTGDGVWSAWIQLPDYTEFEEIKNSVESILESADDLSNWYGIQINESVLDSTNRVTRIGNMDLHRTLPVHKKIRGCVIKVNQQSNTRVEIRYLNNTNWELYDNGVADGLTSSLSGNSGDVFVEIPEFYYKEEIDENNIEIKRFKISEYPLVGFVKSKRFFISAYELTVDYSLGDNAIFRSIVNMSSNYRNPSYSSLDSTPRSLLGHPSTEQSAYPNTFWDSVEGRSDIKYMRYRHWKTIVWLAVVEYKTCDITQNVMSDTIDGYKQGGIGYGAVWNRGSGTAMSNWENYNGCNSVVPCGYTNSLANGSGNIPRTLQNDAGDEIETIYPVRYRGIENIFGNTRQFVWDVRNVQSYVSSYFKSKAMEDKNIADTIGLVNVNTIRAYRNIQGFELFLRTNALGGQSPSNYYAGLMCTQATSTTFYYECGGGYAYINLPASYRLHGLFLFMKTENTHIGIGRGSRWNGCGFRGVFEIDE